MSILTRPCSPFSPALRTVDPVTLRDSLRKRGCSGCELGSQKNFIAPVGFRGNPKSKVMLIGEAPGLYEDRQGIPFTGPCGRLLDEIFTDYKWDLNEKVYITNVVKCRPVAPDGSGKQNLTPQEPHRAACRPYLDQELDWLKPHTVGLLGAVAAESILGSSLEVQPPFAMKDVVGRLYFIERYPNAQFYVMYHPAYLLRARNNPLKKDSINTMIKKHVSEFIALAEDME